MAAPTQRARVALTEALRQARRDADLTGTALAQQLGAGWGQPKVSKIESGRQLPSAAEVEAWAAATRVDPETLLALHARALHEYATMHDSFEAEGGADRQQEVYAAAERAAGLISGFQASIVHGLLQTPAYARHLLHLAGGPKDHGATEDEIDRMVASRMRRSAILYEPGRQITVLVGEAALHNKVGSDDIMREQRDHIARLATTASHATVGIVPFDSFPVLVQHGWDQRDGIITVETTAGDLEIADPAEVSKYEGWAELLREAAVTGHKAAILCERINGTRR